MSPWEFGRRGFIGGAIGVAAISDTLSAWAKQFDAREELDPADPQNVAHANVYYDGAASQRKADAKRLAEACRTLLEPSF